MAAKGEGELLASRARLPEHVVYRAFEAETVLLNLDTGRYHGLNPTGGRMLEALVERERSVREAAKTVAAEYGRPLEEVVADIVPFCRDLGERGLVEFDERAED